MTALWIILAGVAILVATWRLRRANAIVDTILREERERSEREEAAGPLERPTVN